MTPAETVGDPASTGRAIITFRNYIQAAAKAYDHRATLDSLIDAGELVKITEAALDGFGRITAKTPFHATLQSQYKADAQKALALLTASMRPPARSSRRSRMISGGASHRLRRRPLPIVSQPYSSR